MKWVHTTTDPQYSRLYSVWKGMHTRCKDANNPNYGGRGISVCALWNSFDEFIITMGECPPGFTLERLDNGAGYDPFNCVWADRSTQRQNSRPVIAARERAKSKPIYVAQQSSHGSKKMYEKHKCRCDVCVSAFRERKRRIKANRSPESRQRDLEYLKEYRTRKRNIPDYDL